MSSPHIRNVVYNDVPDYITRTVSDRDHNASMTLEQHILLGEKRLILYSDAQCGKTYELNHLAAVLYQSPLFNPFLFSFRRYVAGETLEKQMRFSERFYGEVTPVILLDGYDELPDIHKKEVTGQILSLSEDHPDAVILLSCRMSYESTTVLDGFSKLYLDGLSIASTKEYLRTHCKDPEKLYKEIMDKEYYAVTSGPFFLKEVAAYYNSNGELPHNKSIIYKNYVAGICKKNGERKLWSFDTLGFETKAMPWLKKMAFCMVCSQRQEISFDDLQLGLNLSEQEAEILRDCPLLTITGDKTCSFIHNAFKEYLAALSISHLDLAGIQRIICYEGTTKLRSSMENTLILLLDIIPKESLTRRKLSEWLLKEDQVLVVRCGKELLDLSTRQDLFRQMVMNYKRQKLHIGYSFCGKLMDFCNTSDSIDYLYDELNGRESYSPHLSNLLELLASARLSVYGKEKLDALTNRVFVLLEQNIDDKEHAYVFTSVLDNPVYQNRKILDRFIAVIGDNDNPVYIRQALEIAVNACLCEQYSAWIVNHYKKIHDFWIPGTNITQVVTDNVSDKALGHFTSSKSILAALNSIYEDRESEDSMRERRPLIRKLLDNLKLNSSAEDLAEPVCALLRALQPYHIDIALADGMREVLRAYGDGFFSKQADKCLQMYSFLKESGCDAGFLAEMNVLAILMDEKRMEFILNNQILDEDKTKCFCSWFRMYHWFPESIFDVVKKRFHYPEPVDYQKKRQDDFNCIFNKKKGVELLMALPSNKENGDRSLSVSDEQLRRISLAVKQFLHYKHRANNRKIIHILNVIASFEPELNDEDLVLLFPYMHCDVKYVVKRDDGDSIWGRQISSYTRMLDYILDHITDVRLIDDEIIKVAESSVVNQDRFIELSIYYIINNRREVLYRYLTDLLKKLEWQGTRLTLCVHIANKIPGGFTLIKEYADSFELEDRTIFYEHSLFPIDKCILDQNEVKHATYELITIYDGECPVRIKEKALSALIQEGYVGSLDMALDYLDIHPEWIETDYFPSLSKFDYEEIEKIEKIFDMACAIPKKPHDRIGSYEQALAALKGLGCQSTLARDRVVTLFREKAETTSHNELYYYAQEVYDKFFEDNNIVLDIAQSSKLYDTEVVVSPSGALESKGK